MNSPIVNNSSSRVQLLEDGHEFVRKQAWASAYSSLAEADRQAALEPEDLVSLSISAHLTGREVESAEFLARAHQGFVAQGKPRPAARTASWLSFTSLLKGELAHAGGWLSRARRLLESEGVCVEQGYVMLPAGLRSAREGDLGAAYESFVEAARIGMRFADRDLATMGLQGQGRVLIRQKETARGVALLDEAMVAVKSGEVSAINAAGIYCSVIEACGEIFDLRRAQEWTTALEQWCSTQPDLVPYRGHCLIQRAELLQRQGNWLSALNEAQCACDRLSRPNPKPPVGAAFYRKAEVHRLRGEFAEAERAYAEGSRWERVPRPGLAQLWLAQGKVQAAQTAIQQLVNDCDDPARRAYVLDAAVEIALAAKDLPAAQAAAHELSEIAKSLEAPLLEALSARADGAVSLRGGNHTDALRSLRRALNGFRELQAPYDEACVRVLIALACREQGNSDMATMELRAALEVFRKLGAAPDAECVETLLENKAATGSGPLTTRELEVLKQIASGMTNREIAGKLNISEKTVARHISNIFTKLDLSSRAAATAYAYQRGLA
jgi:DNA-binding NarL/FixJ family response regulator